MVCTGMLPPATIFAVPSPEPAPVAVNVIPTVLLAAPIRVKFVVPRLVITYEVPTTKDPAVMFTNCLTAPPLVALILITEAESIELT